MIETSPLPIEEPSDLSDVTGNEALFRSPEFKQWFGDWEAGECNPYALDPETGLPKVFYHGTVRQFDTFADPATTVSNQGIEVDGMATFFFADKEGAAGYALNLEDGLRGTVAHVAGVFGLRTWNEGIEKWNELMTAALGEDGDRSRVEVGDGLVRFDGKPIGWESEYAIYFGPKDLRADRPAGTKVLTPHLKKTKQLCDVADLLVPEWYSPRVVEAVIAFGETDDEGIDTAHRQLGGAQDTAHHRGLRKEGIDAVVIGSELGMQVSVKDPNRILVLGSKSPTSLK